MLDTNTLNAGDVIRRVDSRYHEKRFHRIVSYVCSDVVIYEYNNGHIAIQRHGPDGGRLLEWEIVSPEPNIDLSRKYWVNRHTGNVTLVQSWHVVKGWLLNHDVVRFTGYEVIK